MCKACDDKDIDRVIGDTMSPESIAKVKRAVADISMLIPAIREKHSAALREEIEDGIKKYRQEANLSPDEYGAAIIFYGAKTDPVTTVEAINKVMLSNPDFNTESNGA